jgi:hypothetical protein
VTRFRAAVTFEYQEQAPDTWRGEIAAAAAQTGAHRAVVAAKRALPGRRPSSIVVLLEAQQAEPREGPRDLLLPPSVRYQTGFIGEGCRRMGGTRRAARMWPVRSAPSAPPHRRDGEVHRAKDNEGKDENDAAAVREGSSCELA